MSSHFEGRDMRVEGPGPAFSLVIGGTPMQNLVLHGELLLETVKNPTIHLGSESAEAQNASLSWLGLGPGLTYYFMPANVHVGAAALLSQMRIKQGDQLLGESEVGFGGALRVGKDFFVGQNLGIGALAQVVLSSMKESTEAEAGSPTWTASAFTLAASITYN